MEDFYTLPEELRAEYELEYNHWLDNLDPVEEEYVLDEDLDLDTDTGEDDTNESYDEYYQDEDETVIGYDDLLDAGEEYRELDFND